MGSKKISKLVPSKLEKAFQQLLYSKIGPLIPIGTTPTQLTAIGSVGGLFAIIFTFLSGISRFFLIGAAIGVIVHLVADDLDGYVARSRNMATTSGAFFDLITDVMFSTFLTLALGISPYANIYVMAFAIPLYGVINVTAMNYIIYLDEFPFPRFGPIEAHLSYIAMFVLAIVFGKEPVVVPFGFELHAADIIAALGLIPTYAEMIRLQLSLYKRLSANDKRKDK